MDPRMMDAEKYGEVKKTSDWVSYREPFEFKVVQGFIKAKPEEKPASFLHTFEHTETHVSCLKCGWNKTLHKFSFVCPRCHGSGFKIEITDR